METSSPEPRKEVTAVVSELLSSARYVVNATGDRTDVVLSLLMWEGLVALLEDLDDREVVRKWLPKLQAGPEAAGALRWADVSAEWDDEPGV